MPGGRTKFNVKWLENKDENGDIIHSWCTKDKDEWRAYCMLCKCSILVSNGGLSQLMQHASTMKHSVAAKQQKGQKTLDFFAKNKEGKSFLTVPNTLSMEQLVTRAEAIWAIKVAASNFSFASCKDVVPVFSKMFENHAIAKNMHLSDRKVSYVLAYGLGPLFRDEVVSDLQASIAEGNFFTMSFDEATTAQSKKQLDIIVRFWSPKLQKITVGYITSLFFGHAVAEDIFKGILKALEDEKLPKNKVLMLSMDGPNVNLAVAKKLNTELANSGSSELVDLGTCTLHKIHNCFHKALDNFPLDIDELATDLFSFFKASAARREDLKDLEKLLECEEKFLLRHVDSRWMTLGPVVDRIISIYPALKQYFLQFLPKEKTSWKRLQNNARYKRIVIALKDPLTLVYLKFILAISPDLQKYLALFQTEGPIIHLMFSKMNLLLRSVMLRFLKEETVGSSEGYKLLSIDTENHDNYLLLKHVNVGEGTRRALLHLKETEAKEARMAMRSFLVKLSNLIKDSLPLDNNFLRALEKLHPSKRSVKNNNAIRRLCMELKPMKMDNELIDRIIQEFQTYKIDPVIDNIVKDYCQQGQNNTRIDNFWKSVFDVNDAISGRPKYKNLAILVKNCLALSHGNADVERGFSANKLIISSIRTSLSETTIVAIRHVQDAVKRYGDICSIPITGKLLNAVTKSHSMYVEAKESEKKEKELNKKRAAIDSEEMGNEEKKLKKETEHNIATVSNTIKHIQDDILAAQRCMNEGNERLQTALKKKDFQDMKIAATMLDAASNKLQQKTKELNAEQEKKLKLQSSLNKKK